jgi:hypothetical protein
MLHNVKSEPLPPQRLTSLMQSRGRGAAPAVPTLTPAGA